MLVDSLHIPAGNHISCDVCIIGAGAAGIAIAHALEGSKNSVVLLESGNFQAEQNIQDLYKGTTSENYPLITNRYLTDSRLRYFGGSSNHWGGQSLPFEPEDFEPCSWVPESGWPFSRRELDPYYARAREFIGLRPFPEGPSLSSNGIGPAQFPGPMGSVISRAFQSAPPKLRIGISYRTSVLSSPDISLHLNATAVKLESAGSGAAISCVIASNLAGKRYSIGARRYVLACGGIENARVLLASDNINPHGVGNDNDLVGRYFMEHPHFYGGVGVVALWKESLSRLSVAGGNPTGHFPSAVFKRERKILGSCLQLVPLKSGQECQAIWGPQDKLIIDLAKKIDRQSPTDEYNLFRIISLSEQSPNRESRVTLGTERDGMGMRRVHLNWRVQEHDLSSYCVFVEEFFSQIAAARIGRGKVLYGEPGALREHMTGGCHHMGTTRMSVDKKRGVVDSDCRVHGIENLFVAGSSVFPTSAAVNPTYTLLALAFRLAEKLRGELHGPILKT